MHINRRAPSRSRPAVTRRPCRPPPFPSLAATQAAVRPDRRPPPLISPTSTHSRPHDNLWLRSSSWPIANPRTNRHGESALASSHPNARRAARRASEFQPPCPSASSHCRAAFQKQEKKQRGAGGLRLDCRRALRLPRPYRPCLTTLLAFKESVASSAMRANPNAATVLPLAELATATARPIPC